MQTDSRIGGGASAHVYRHPLLAGISVFLQCLTTVADPKAKRRVRWTPQAASTAAVLMSLEECSALRARFSRIHSCMKTDFSRRRRTGRTYNGLLKALQRQKEHILPLVKQELRRQAVLRWKRMDPSGP